jgi:ferredoxin
VLFQGYTPGCPAALVVELDGVSAEAEEDFARVQDICRRNATTHIRIARDPVERAKAWKGRKAAFAAMGRISPDYFVQDGVIPRTKLGGTLTRIREMSEAAGLRVANVFHAGDGPRRHLRGHFDACLGCMACVTACPSGIQYDKLIEAVRPQLERNHRRRWDDRAFRALIFSLFPDPSRLRVTAVLGAAYERVGGHRLELVSSNVSRGKHKGAYAVEVRL